MRKIIVLLIMLLLPGVSAYAVNGDLTVYGTINAGSGGVKFQDGTVQKTAAVQVLSEGTANPGTNDYTIIIPPTTGKINLTYSINPTVDGEPIMLGFNDNLTATGSYDIYSVIPPTAAIAGKVHAGYGRTVSGQYNNFDIIPVSNLILIKGDHLSEANMNGWGVFFKGSLKYDSPQSITKINLKCYNAGTNISHIEWKVMSVP